jgi:Cu/Ag efflux pump CusA
VSARAGRAELDEDAAPIHRLEMDLRMIPGDDRELDQIVLDTARRIGRVPGLTFSLEGFLSERVHEVLAGDRAPVVAKVFGPSLPELRTLSGEVAEVMRQTPGLRMVRVEPQIDVPELRILPDRAVLLRAGVRTSELASAVVEWRQGHSVAELVEPSGRVVEVALAGPPAYRDRQALGDIPVSTRAMGEVTVSSLAQIDEVPSPSVVNREGGERRIAIGASTSGASLSGAVSRLESTLEKRVRPLSGYRIELSGESVARSEAALRLVTLGALVLLGIFVLLAIAFGSLRDAAIVLLNIPLGLVGGVVAAAVTPEGLSVAGFVGFVTLFGIICRNGIMLVSHKRHLDAQFADQDPIQRVLRAAEERLLPILMTAATAGLGLLPLAVSLETAGSELEAPMALIVCAGLVSSTALNMIVLPTVYVWLERRRSSAKRAAKG